MLIKAQLYDLKAMAYGLETCGTLWINITYYLGPLCFNYNIQLVYRQSDN